MLNNIITYINGKIGELNMFKDIRGLCELIQVDGKSFPAEYCNNEYKHLDFDFKGSLVYHRQTGQAGIGEADEEQAISCDPFLEKTYPMKTILYVKKDVFGSDNNDAYVDSKIAENVLNAIYTSNNRTLRNEISVDSISVNVTSVSTDREEIFNDEYPNAEKMVIPYEYAYVSIEYDIVVTGQLSCFNSYTC